MEVPMVERIERRRLIGWIMALLALPALAACESGGMFGQRGSDDDDSDSDGGMGGSTGGSTGGGY
jgi:hypothetical protein